MTEDAHNDSTETLKDVDLSVYCKSNFALDDFLRSKGGVLKVELKGTKGDFELVLNSFGQLCYKNCATKSIKILEVHDYSKFNLLSESVAVLAQFVANKTKEEFGDSKAPEVDVVMWKTVRGIQQIKEGLCSSFQPAKPLAEVLGAKIPDIVSDLVKISVYQLYDAIIDLEGVPIMFYRGNDLEFDIVFPSVVKANIMNRKLKSWGFKTVKFRDKRISFNHTFPKDQIDEAKLNGVKMSQGY